MQAKDFDRIRDRLNGVSRRDFMKFCTVIAASLGLPLEMAPRIANAITSPRRPSVIWLSGQACTGCVETLLRPSHPSLEHLILDLISLDYNETLNAGAGHQAEEEMQKAINENAGKFIMVVDGAIPLKDGGIYCMVGNRPFVDIVREVDAKAGAVIAIGSCASWGGIPSAAPNPTGAVGLPEVLKNRTVVTVPGCPPNPYNFLSTVLHYLTFNKLPALDSSGRPKFAYGRLIHENCERRPHFDAGRFANKFGDEGHRLGYCLYKLGCKGPQTYANCPAVLFSDVGAGAWPVGTGHPCFGCTEQGVGFTIPLFTQAIIKDPTPAAGQPPISDEKGTGISVGSAALLAGAAGVALGAGAVFTKKLGQYGDDDQGNSAGGE
ncbi:MAG: hydrogenase small subunit [Proteobacteria bacterium]|nr:hydrogenase small subunit [Pseudomonadota bacterium]MBU1717035.1 hydrogenase small subunit [Pseudomonadota bacterium]